MKVKKQILMYMCAIVLGLGVAGLSAVNITDISAASYNTKTVYKLSNIKFSYDTDKKQLQVKGNAKGLKKVKIFYNNKKIKTTKVNKQGNFNANLTFKGYQGLTLYGVNKNNQKATPKMKVSREQYAAPTPTVIKAVRESDGSATYNVETNKGCTLDFYYGNEKIIAVKVTAENTQVVLPASELKNKVGHFNVRQERPGKKDSSLCKAAIPDIGTTVVTSF
ncbi:hypothetical protein OZY43_02655 [Lactobacillus sp. ESL0785]|uniref:hypothetical protein n=1 Tax=Lactobacillus sp. ESL0785 TaxID=2983232 RepID=UPI0023F946D3|nr:hypothetical protein [Lactobacillus sp. ESL0785]WEV71318.1 hypothetical protein OZY43_02655 [Lactobacillus sp. ESL0785]